MKKYLRSLKKQKHPLRFLTSRILWMTGLSKMITIRREHYRLHFFPTALSALYWIDPNEERLDEVFFGSYLRQGDAVIDIGANVGTSSLSAAHLVGDKGKILAFEPHPVIFNYLTQNIALNGFSNIHPYNLALGDKRGTVSFSSQHGDAQNRVREDGKLSISVDRLDHILENTPLAQVDLLKIDVEGYELFIFKGATSILSRTRCVFFECYERQFKTYQYHSQDLFDFLKAQGFRIFQADRLEGNRLAIRDLEAYQARMGKNAFPMEEL